MSFVETPPDPLPPARAAFIAPETRWFIPEGPFQLESGASLPRLQVAFRTWGSLSPEGDNAVVVCHAFTGSADVDRWWTRMFGAGQAFDPDRDFVICSNILGSCYGTTGPATVDPATGRPWLGSFPAVTLREAHERPEGMDAGVLVMSGLSPERVLQAVRVVTMEPRLPSDPVGDYVDRNVSGKVARVILSYVDYVNRTVWGKAREE